MAVLKNQKPVLVLLACLWFSVASAARGPEFDQWVAKQQAFSLDRTFENISPAGTLPGCVVAATSKQGSQADYWYNWTRDAGLVMQALLSQYETTNDFGLVQRIEKVLFDYIAFNNKIQRVKNRSSSESDPWGLGEPKWNVDGTAFTGDWGRPQNDGPALRTSAVLRFARAYIKRGGDRSKVEQLIYSPTDSERVANRDLDMLTGNIWKKSWDLWEEISGFQFYTSLVQRRALLDGSEMASFFGNQGAAQSYGQKAGELQPALESHWDGGRGYLISTRDRNNGIDYKNSNLDTAIVLAAIHGQGDRDGYFAADNDKVLATALALRNKHREAFAINQRYRPDLPPAIGRYTEDRYFNGNPWFLTTLALSELHYKVIQRAVSRGAFEITPISAPFFRNLGVDAQPGRVSRDDPKFAQVAKALANEADGYMERAKVHMGGNSATGQGRMDEQISREDGFMKSATDLTWSYASFVTAAEARKAVQAAYPEAFKY